MNRNAEAAIWVKLVYILSYAKLRILMRETVLHVLCSCLSDQIYDPTLILKKKGPALHILKDHEC